MVVKVEIGWHRLVAMKNCIKRNNPSVIDESVYLKNGIKVNIEYINADCFLGRVIKGNSSFKKHDIVKVKYNEIDNNIKGEIVEFRTK